MSESFRLSTRELRHLYAVLAPAYDAFATAVSSTARTAALNDVRHVLEESERAAPGERGSHVLVAGCGTGLSLLALSALRTVDWIEAVDASPAMLDRAWRRIGTGADITDRIGIRLADLRDLSYPTGAFDLVLSLYVLDVLPQADRVQALRSIARVLRPGGTLITATVAPPRRPVEHLWAGAARAVPLLLGGAHPVDLRIMLRQTGFDIHRSSRHVQAGLPSQIVVSRKRPASDSNAAYPYLELERHAEG